VKGYEYTKYKTKNPVVQKLIERFFRRVARVIKDLEFSKVLDAGCGDGEALVKLRSMLPDTKNIIGADLDADQINSARMREPEITFEVCDLKQLPYKDDQFDLVLSLEVLEHISNPEQVLKELVRVSSKYIILSVPHEPIFMIGNLLRGKNIAHLGNDPQHINHWGLRSFHRFISGYIDVISVSSSFPWLIAIGKKRNSLGLR